MQYIAPGLRPAPTRKLVVAHAITWTATLGFAGIVVTPIYFLKQHAGFFEVAVSLPMTAALIYGTVAALRRL